MHAFPLPDGPNNTHAGWLEAITKQRRQRMSMRLSCSYMHGPETSASSTTPLWLRKRAVLPPRPAPPLLSLT